MSDLLDALAPVVTTLDRLGVPRYVAESMIRSAIKERSFFNLIHQRTIYKIDIFLPKGRPHDARAMSRRRSTEMIPGRSVSVATAEDVISAKLEWHRLGDEVLERQWNDVLGIADLLDRALREARTFAHGPQPSA